MGKSPQVVETRHTIIQYVAGDYNADKLFTIYVKINPILVTLGMVFG
jgi:hypothetical protein